MAVTGATRLTVRVTAIVVASLLVACNGRPAMTAEAAALPLQLPASYRGSLPCNECAGTDVQLDLWADGVFHLDRHDGPGDTPAVDEVGRWRRDPGTSNLLLYGGREAPLQFRIVDQRTLRALDLRSQPAAPGSEFDLRTNGSMSPADLRLRLHGMVIQVSGVLRFEECLTGRTYPLAHELGYAALQGEYLALSQAALGEPILASFDGGIGQRQPLAGGATGPAVIVRRLTGLWPGQSCERAMSHASLSNQYWRIDRLRAVRVATQQEASGDMFVMLRGVEGGYVASAGCGRYSGAYRVEGTGIAFESPATVPACPESLRGRQQQLLDALASASRWAIQGQVLELFDAAGNSLAAAEAIYFH